MTQANGKVPKLSEIRTLAQEIVVPVWAKLARTQMNSSNQWHRHKWLYMGTGWNNTKINRIGNKLIRRPCCSEKTGRC